MNITNNFNLPQPIVSAVSHVRKPEPYRIGVTELIDSPLIRILKRRHWDDLSEDASDRIWALLGSSVHAILQSADTTEHLSEEKLSVNIGPFTLVGVPDLLDSEGVLSDYKVTSVFSFLLGMKKEWAYQLNLYKYLYTMHGFRVKKLQIVAILRDWQKSKAEREPDYPNCPIYIQNIPIMPTEELSLYLDSRIKAHADAINGKIVPCNEDERWKRPTTWAVRKAGAKRALRVFDSKEEGINYIQESGKVLVIEERPGLNVRCESYCPVREFCEWRYE